MNAGHMLQCKSRRRILDVKPRKLSDSEKNEALWLLHVLAKRAVERNKDLALCSVDNTNTAPVVLKEDKLSVSSLPVKTSVSSATSAVHVLGVPGVGDVGDSASTVPSTQNVKEDKLSVSSLLGKSNTGSAAVTVHGLGLPSVDDVSDAASTAPSTQNGGEEQFAERYLPPPTYADFINQIADYPEIPGYESREEKRMKIIRVVQTCYDQRLKASHKEMLNILRVENLNSFNLRDLKRCSAGWIMYPQASMMNHACYPNTGCTMIGNHLIFETLRGVEEGEELLQSYLGSNTATDSWGFTCQCDRCRGVDPPGEWDKFVAKFRCKCGCITPRVGTGGCHCQDGLFLDSIQDAVAAQDVETEE